MKVAFSFFMWSAFSLMQKSYSHSDIAVSGMGSPQVKFGESVVFLEHVITRMRVGVDIAGRSLSKHNI